MLWNNSLETGIPLIDEQHQELFKRIDSMLSPSNKNRVPETFKFLEEYVLVHFRDEQKMHQSSKYPKAAPHKTYHDNYIAELKKLKQLFATEGDKLTFHITLNKTVVDWLTNHIMVHDKEFAKYYKSLSQ